ncbi:MAG: hypothetical protein PHO10_00785 [Gemmiger sp.]|nr:hypothetical protein [Gemmiger sp.]
MYTTYTPPKRRAFFLLVAAFACLLLSGCGAPKTVEAARYLSLDYSGYNGEGTAALAVDTPGLADAIYRAMGLAATPESGSADEAAALKALSALTVWATPESALSNGDSVAVNGSVDAAILAESGIAGLSLQCTPFTATVAGLDTTRPIDPFENVTVSWAGSAPGITMQIALADTLNAPYSWISYTPDHNTELAAGDTVTLTATADAQTLENLGYELSRTTMRYTVPDYLGNYLLGWQYLDAAGQQTLQAKAELGAALASLNRPAVMPLTQNGAALATVDSSFTSSDYALHSCYYLTSKTGQRPADGPGWYNALVGVYSFKISSGDGEYLTAYAAFALPDVTLSAGGLVFQSEAASYYRTADTDPAALTLTPPESGNAYLVSPVSFALAATLETAAGA